MSRRQLRDQRTIESALRGLLVAVLLLVPVSALADAAPEPEHGCGCETTNDPRTYTALSVAFMGLGLVLFRRSRRARG
ncbi:MAG: hypothetical protein KC766_31945 [Myxococcales bacterium]|nr:hypothetical protein [Myxococcales bacterium]